MNTEENEKEIKIKPIIKALTKRLWLIVLITAAVGGAGTYYQNSNVATPVYSASSSIIIEESAVDKSTLKVFMTEPIVLKDLANQLSLDLSIVELRNMISATEVEGSQIIQLTVNDSTPESAVAIANSLGIVVPKVVNERFGESEINMLSEALIEESRSPINPPTNRLMQFSIILGLLLGIGVALLLESLDYKVRSEREVESIMEIPVLGAVSKIRKSSLKNHPVQKGKSSLRGETIA